MSSNLASIRRRTSFYDQGVSVTLKEDAVDDISSRASALSSSLGISEVTAKLLLCRGVSDVAQAKEFLAPSLREHLPSPAKMKNLANAVSVILDAIEANKAITVYTDFDVDGLSSGSQLIAYIHELGGRVSGYTPDRFTEGYGLSVGAVEKLARAGCNLLITVDCGISSHREITRAKQLGLTTVILDHHQPHGLPPADVVVDPAQDGCEFQSYALAAAGIVWMALILLRSEALKRAPERELTDPKQFLDLAALGTICDMVPLTGPNRVIAHRGLEAMRRTTRVGLIALKQVCGVDGHQNFGAGHVGFMLGPRINAAGRIGDASQILELLTTSNSKKAASIAKAVDKANLQRQNVEQQVLSLSIDQIMAQQNPHEKFAFAIFGENFHLGVIGIVAQRIVEQFNRPTAVMAMGEMQIGSEVKQVIKGSVRSISGFHVADALESIGHCLINHGGHKAAGGFSLLVENLEEFQKAFIEAATKVLSPEMLARERNADCLVRFSDIDYNLVNELMSLAPFGIGNPSPVLVTKNTKIETVQALSSGHLKFRVSDGKCHFNALGWNFQGHPLIEKDRIVSLAYSPEINSYKGVSSVQLTVKEVWE